MSLIFLLFPPISYLSLKKPLVLKSFSLLDLIQDRPLKKKKRNFFTPTKEEKMEMRIEKINRKIVKKERNLQRVKNLERSILEQQEKLQKKRFQTQVSEGESQSNKEARTDNNIVEMDQKKYEDFRNQFLIYSRLSVFKEKMTPLAKMISELNVDCQEMSYLGTYLLNLASKSIEKETI